MSLSLTAKLGTDSGVNPRTTHNGTEDIVHLSPTWPEADNDKDYFVERNGVKFAGTHLLLDLWGASHLDDLDITEKALRESAEIAGVLVLAESHISIHTWPERGFAALDIFMCGECDPYKAIAVLKGAFSPAHIFLGEQKRGMIP